MQSELVFGAAIQKYEEFIPGEYSSGINQTRFQVLGAAMFREPCGALVFETEKTPGKTPQGRLVSIYVSPAHRRLGVGSSLLSSFLSHLRALRLYEASFFVRLEGDRRMLPPFFQQQEGVETEILEFPLGRCSIKDVIAAFRENGLLKGAASGTVAADLKGPERQIVSAYLREEFDQPLEDYLNAETPGFFQVDHSELSGILLFSRGEAALELSYLLNKGGDGRRLAGLLLSAKEHLERLYSPWEHLEMLLTTDQALALYRKMFGEPRDRAVLLRGSIHCR